MYFDYFLGVDENLGVKRHRGLNPPTNRALLCWGNDQTYLGEFRVSPPQQIYENSYLKLCNLV